ncbi:MAG: peptidyl-prolyl cis-trans isomerase [Candidatus Sulfotelmatobacter sp.]
MRKSWLLCVLLGTLAWGQAAPSSPAPMRPTPPEDASASVPPTAAVITVIGVCPAQGRTAAAKTTAGKTATKAGAAKTPAGDCKTVITKAEFEKLADALAPNVTPQLKRQLAGLLPRLIALSDAAKKQGIDKGPQYAETLKFVKMQVLANELQRKIQKEAADIPPAEIEKYYKENPEAYEQYTVERLFVPRTKQSDNEVKAEEDEKDQKLTDDQKKAKEAAEKAKAEDAEQSMTKLADDLRERAAKGEDFAKLQKEAFEAAGMKIESPTVTLPNLRRTGLPPAHAAVFDLKPGEVSQVISDAGGHYIYKIVSKSEMPFDQAKNEIHNRLQNDRMRDLMEKLNNSFKTETNEAYFGPGGAGPLPPPHMPRPRPGTPPAQSTQPQTPPPAAKPN